jgi:chloride channel protein, CIC family
VVGEWGETDEVHPDDIRSLETRDDDGDRRASAGLLTLALTAAAAGAVTGVVGALFRLALREADHGRVDLIHDLRPWGALGFTVVVVGVAACAAAARAVVRLAPAASGSGVQRVEAVMRGDVEPASPRVLPVKFLGGLLALGSGMVLGREGPTVQMGAVIGDWFSTRLRLARVDLRRMQAATAGAGLAVAFSAPIGGAVFAIEEVARSTTLRLIVATLSACASAVAVAWVILGAAPDFAVVAPAAATARTVIPFVVFGALLGAFAVLYNRVIVACLDLADRLSRIPPEVRAAAIGAIVGAALWLERDLVGGGDRLSQDILSGGTVTLTLLGILALRTAIGPLSYAAGTPGGLFAPLIVIGALAGALFATALGGLWPSLHLHPIAFAIVGMSTFFAAVVRAPLTGIVLIMEMTGTTSQAVPMLGAAGVAVTVSALLGGRPIYDTLRERMAVPEPAAGESRQMVAERSMTGADAVQHPSFASKERTRH